jgi:hypothetical protein
MTRLSSRARAEQFRHLVILVIRASGLRNVTGKIQFDSVEDVDAALEVADAGHVWNLPLPLTVVIRDMISTKWGTSLDLADRAAASSPTSLGGVLIQRRMDRPVEDSFVVLRLSTMTNILNSVEMK